MCLCNSLNIKQYVGDISNKNTTNAAENKTGCWLKFCRSTFSRCVRDLALRANGNNILIDFIFRGLHI